MGADSEAGFPVRHATELNPRAEEHVWLIDQLWGAEDVGIIGGEPKCCKSFLALHMAVAVASNTPCLERFSVQRSGRVLLYAAEDALHMVRERLDGLCAHAELELSELDLWVITAPAVRLDVASHRRRLFETVAELKPVLLILDPFVRLHRVDENVSAQVAPLLASLRELQRTHHCAVTLVHHFKKSSGNGRAGQALRGTSEFHAWFDAGLFLRRKDDQLRLTVEHRAHRACDPIQLEIVSNTGTVCLSPVQPDDNRLVLGAAADRARVLNALHEFNRPVRIRELRAECRIRTSTLCAILQELHANGGVRNTPRGWVKHDAG